MYLKLGRWLRILGFDTYIDPSFVDQQYIELAKKEDRILITRDRDLLMRAKKQKVRTLILESIFIEDQLIEISRKLHTKLFDIEILPRCTICNSQIKPITKEEIVEKISEGTRKFNNEFWICTNKQCQKIYWKGAHWININKSIEQSKIYYERKKKLDERN